MAAPSANGSSLSLTLPRTRGRPRKAGAKTQAERAKAYRDRLKASGRREVKCYLDAEHLAYLKGICAIHGGTIADALALALSALIRGESPTYVPCVSASSQLVIEKASAQQD